MFYAALFSLHHCNNDSIEKLISIDIYSNYIFLLILASVIGNPYGIQRVKDVLMVIHISSCIYYYLYIFTYK